MTASKTNAPAKKAATKKKATEPTVTKCPPAKAKGAKTTAGMPRPKRKPGAAKKPATKKARTKKTGGKGGVWALDDFSNDDVITVVTAKPYEDGSVAASRFRLFKSGQTVGECLEAQRDAGFLRRRVAIRKALEAGHIKIGKK